MNWNDWANKELDILEYEVNQALDKLEHSTDEDPDTIGTEIENSKIMYEHIDIMRAMLRELDKRSDNVNMNYIFQKFIDLSKLWPLSELHSYEELPDEWSSYDDPHSATYHNSRYPMLLRRVIRYETEPDKDVVIYSDPSRFEFYNLITSSKIFIESGLRNELYTILDTMLPITFPYHPREKVKIYIENFACTLQPEGPVVQSLALTHYLPYGAGNKPIKIYQFFDITDGKLNALDFKAYINRKQIFEKQAIEESEKLKESLNKNDNQ